jgi:hypothetical protein
MSRYPNLNSVSGYATMIAAWVMADHLYRHGFTREQADRFAARDFGISIAKVRKWRKGERDKQIRRQLELSLARSTS